MALDKNIVMTFTGLANSGKDTCVEKMKTHFEKHGKKVFCLAYGDYVKSLCTRNFGYDDTKKEDFRDLLQLFGTDLVRNIEEDFWVRVVFTTIDLLNDEYDVFLISDARFMNELQPFPWKIGYPIFNVLINREFENNLTDEQNAHISEDLATNPPEGLFHITINNNGTLDDLSKMCFDIVKYVTTIQDNYKELKEQETEEEALNVFEKMMSEVEFNKE